MKKFTIQKELLSDGQGYVLKFIQKLYQNVRTSFTPCFKLAFIAVQFLVSCSDDDQKTEGDPWHQELEQLRTAVTPYHNIEHAISDGYDNEFTGYRSQMGYHYLKASLLDDRFEIEQPEVVMYAPDAAGNLQFVGVEYAVPIENMDSPTPAPEGFTGDADVWEINTEFKVWTLHVWVGIENPHGIFTSHNPNLP